MEGDFVNSFQGELAFDVGLELLEVGAEGLEDQPEAFSFLAIPLDLSKPINPPECFIDQRFILKIIKLPLPLRALHLDNDWLPSENVSAMEERHPCGGVTELLADFIFPSYDHSLGSTFSRVIVGCVLGVLALAD